MSFAKKSLSLAVLMALGGTAAAANVNNPAADRALGLIQSHGAAIKASPADRFVARDVIVDADGTEHVRFERTFHGLPVIGGDFVTHARNGQFKAASLTLGAPLNLGTRAGIKAGDAIVAAGAEFGSNFAGTPTASLVVYARGAAALAYQVQMANDDNDMTYIVDARNGKILDRWSNRETARVRGGGTTCTNPTRPPAPARPCSRAM